MATLKTGTTIAGQTAWHSGNDGTGSGLDADLLDGSNSNALVQATVATTAPSSPRVGEMWVKSNDTFLAYDDAWIYPTFLNGWTNYHPTWSQARYAKLLSGYVYCEGLIVGGTNGSVCFTLPVGYRPSHWFIQQSMHNPNTAAILYVAPTGEVRCQYGSGGSGDLAWGSIHGMWFGDQ